MKYKIKKIFKLEIYFILIFLSIYLFGKYRMDNYWNFGEALSIVKGRVLYKDINIIIPPLYQLFMSALLFFKQEYYIFILQQSILVLLFIHFCQKKLQNNFFILMPIITFQSFILIYPSYNFLLLFLIIILITLEEKKVDDKYIGILLSMIILTKHNIGGIIFILSLLSTHSLSRSFKRIIYCMPLLIIFIFYLIINNTLFNFIDLCILGLFDFGKNNSSINPILIVILIFLIIYLYKRVKTNKNDSTNYYLFASLFFGFPILNYSHFIFTVFIFVYVFIKDKKKNQKNLKNLKFITTIIVIMNLINSYYSNGLYIKDITLSNFKHFKYTLLFKEEEKYYKKLKKEYKKGNNYIFSINGMYIDILSDHDITYFDIPAMGNFGYDGNNKMKKKIDKMHNTYFYIKDDEWHQYPKDIYKYIKKTGQYKKDFLDYKIYYLK